MLVEFIRATSQSPARTYDGDLVEGEDDGLGEAPRPVERKIHVNPVHVAAVFASRHDGVTVIRLGDGRGFLVKGSCEETHEKLEAAGRAAEE